MQIKDHTNDGLTHEFTIVIPAADIEKAAEKELQEIGKKVKIDGFRPGKVPANVLKQKYGKNVMGEVVQKSVDGSARELMEEKDLRPADKPELEITEFEEGGDLTYTLKMEVIPAMPKIDYAKVKVEKLAYEIDEAEVEKSLERLAEQYKGFETKGEDAKAEMNDAVMIDFIGRIDGEAFPGGTGNDTQLVLGAGQFIPGFEEQLVGSKAGDKVDVEVSFPEEYHSKDLAGKPAVFETTVKDVLVAEKATKFDDEFAKKINFETMDKLKEAIRESLEGNYSEVARSKEKKSLFDALDGVLKVELPQKMVGKEFDSVMAQYEKAKEAGQLPEAEAKKKEADVKKEYQELSERRVKLGLLLAHIAEEEKIQINQQELTQAMFKQAQQFPGQEAKVMEYYQQNPQMMEELRGPILEEKAVDFLFEKVERTEKKVSLKELLDEEEETAKAA